MPAAAARPAAGAHLLITPQAILPSELPDGCVVKSSGFAWMITVLPITSFILNRSVSIAYHAYPLSEKRGGRSPACSGCGQFSGLKCVPASANGSSWLPVQEPPAWICIAKWNCRTSSGRQAARRCPRRRAFRAAFGKRYGTLDRGVFLEPFILATAFGRSFKIFFA